MSKVTKEDMRGLLQEIVNQSRYEMDDRDCDVYRTLVALIEKYGDLK